MKSILSNFNDYVNKRYNQNLVKYDDLHLWSISNLSYFWKSIVDFFKIEFDSKPKSIFQNNKDFLNVSWFPGSKISYSKNVFRNSNNSKPAIKFQDESGFYIEISWNSLKSKTLEFQKVLINNNIKKGDRVVAYCSNRPEVIAAFLAVNSLGAIWSSCSPDFGFESVNERFNQLQPKLLLYHEEYKYKGNSYNLKYKADKIKNSIRSIQSKINLNEFSTFKTKVEIYEFHYESVDFNHPIWILFSSGTTGKPKAITHGTGMMILEHCKALGIHQNVYKSDNFFWYSTTGWMMWNYSLSCLLLGATLCLYDGPSNFPDSGVIWRFAEKSQINHFGHGATYFQNLVNNVPVEVKSQGLANLKSIGSTGSPLFAETHLKLNNLFPMSHIISLSGGTDVCTAFIGGNPNKKSKPGEIQCKMLGASIEVWDHNGKKIINKMGELVITKPLISMPLFFWDDPKNKRINESYFSKFSGIWNHGDWVTETKSGSFIVHGRSDSTLNRFGVRIGTSEIYSTIENLDYINDSLVIHLDSEIDKLLLFIQTRSKIDKANIKKIIRDKCSPRHVPDHIFEVPQIPYTISGKKVEVPIKKLLMGYNPNLALSLDSLRNPESIDWFTDFYLNFFNSSA